MVNTTVRLLISLCLVFSFSLFAQGADDANQSTYDDGWQTGDDGGSGFGAWTLNTGINDGNLNGFFIGSSNIDVNGESWGFYANNNGLAEAFRTLDAPLGANTSFSIKMDNGGVDNGGTVGFALQNDAGTNLFEFLFIGGQSNYTINDQTSGRDTGLGFSDQGLNLNFTFSANNNYQVQITLLAGGSNTISGTLSDTPTKIRLFNANAGSGSTKDLFFNSLSITDNEEPTTQADNFNGNTFNGTFQDNSRISAVEVKNLPAGASLSVGGQSLSNAQTQSYSSNSLDVQATGNAGDRIDVVITDGLGKRRVWTLDFF